jgi:hypothetical protein
MLLQVVAKHTIDLAIRQYNMADIQIQQPSKGYGSYLTGIIPPDIAVAAGAFSAAMQQIQNIQEVQIEKFAQVVTNIETMVGLNTNSNSNNLVPTNLPLRTLGRPKIALGSGPQGSYTMSDFFGCMSGLPYNGRSYLGPLLPECGLEGIYNKLNQLATRKLFNIYHETYLAVTEQRAKMGIAQPYWYVISKPYVPPTAAANPTNPDYNPTPIDPEPDPDPPYNDTQYTYAPTDSPVYWSHPGSPEEYDWYYRITFQVDVTGGGYGRGTAPNPIVTIRPNNVGASSVSNVGRDDNDIPGMFGRVSTSNNFGHDYLWAHTVQDNWAVTIYPVTTPPHYPPKDDGWVRANMPEEIIDIQAPPIQMLPVQANGNFSTDGQNTPGFAISYKGVKSQGTWFWPRGGSSPGMNQPITGYINQANAEIDYINSTNKANCQKLNDYWNSTGFQLTIEQRARQEGLRPPLDNPRENFLSLYPTTIYTFVDSVPQYGKNTEPHMYAQTIENIANWDNIGGQSLVGMMRETRNQSRLTALGISLDNNINDTLPYDQQKVLIANGTLPTGVANPNIPSGATTANPNDPFIPRTTTPSTPVVIRDRVTITPQPAGVINVGTGEFIIINPEYVSNVVNNVGNIVPGEPIDVGDAVEPGSFAGSPYTNLIPPNLNSWYTSSTLMPSTYTVNEAIDEVIRCNCDCWNLA